MSRLRTPWREPACKWKCAIASSYLLSLLILGGSVAVCAEGNPAVSNDAAFLVKPSTEVVPEPGRDDKWRAVWMLSLGAHAAGTVFDAYSSYHRGPYEANSLLADSNGQFGGKAIAIKGGIFAGGTALQYFILRWASRRDSHLARITAQTFSIINFGAGATYSAAAIHNFGVVQHH